MSEQMISSTSCERANELEEVVKNMEQQTEELSRRSADILLIFFCDISKFGTFFSNCVLFFALGMIKIEISICRLILRKILSLTS